jgi:hypothetical protein
MAPLPTHPYPYQYALSRKAQHDDRRGHPVHPGVRAVQHFSWNLQGRPVEAVYELLGSGQHERSGGVLNRTCLPSDIVAFVVFCRLRDRLTLLPTTPPLRTLGSLWVVTLTAGRSPLGWPQHH